MIKTCICSLKEISGTLDQGKSVSRDKVAKTDDIYSKIQSKKNQFELDIKQFNNEM
jgi:hypothetical protein